MKFDYPRHKKKIQVALCVPGIIVSIAVALQKAVYQLLLCALAFVGTILIIVFQRQIFEFNMSFQVYDYKNAEPSDFALFMSEVIFWMLIGTNWYCIDMGLTGQG